MANPLNPKKNNEGYDDLTAYLGMKEINRRDREIENGHRLLIYCIRCIAGLAGFEVQGRIVLKHRESGRIFR